MDSSFKETSPIKKIVKMFIKNAFNLIDTLIDPSPNLYFFLLL